MTLKDVEKIGNRILLFAVCVFIALALLCSCASRKVNRSETKEQTEVKTEVKDTLVKNTEVKTTVVTVTDTDELELTPIDTTKPIIVTDSKGNSKSYFNSIVRTKRTSNKANINKVEKVAENGKKEVKSDYKAVTTTNNKQTEAKRCFNLWWLIILIVGFIIWQRKRLF